MAANAETSHIPAQKLSRVEVKDTIRYSMSEGIASSAGEGATEQYYTPYLLAVGGMPITVGWLVTIAQLVTAFCYLKLPSFVSRIGSRKRAVMWLVMADALSFIPFIFLPFLIKDNVVALVLAFYVVSVVPGVAVNPIWASWITDLVPAGLRGRYHGFRSTYAGISNLACFIGAGLVLSHFEHDPFIGFAIIFGFAVVVRLVSWFVYRKMTDIPTPVKEADVRFSIPEVIQAVRFSAVGKFMVFTALFYFSMFLASPFYAVFMLDNLNFSYAQFMIIVCSEQVARLLLMQFWGKYADLNGNIKAVRITCMIIPVLPLLWLFSQNIFYLIAINVLAGAVMAGFELCTPNFIYSTAPAGSRIRYIAYFRSLTAVAMALGALIGGYLATFLPPILGYSIFTLFLVSAIARILVAWRMLPPVVDIAHKRGTTSEIIYRRRGMLTNDASSYGAGWGLLYVPSFKLGGFGKEPVLAQKKGSMNQGTGGDGLTAKAIIALRSRFSGEIKAREDQINLSPNSGKSVIHDYEILKAIEDRKDSSSDSDSSIYPKPTLDPKSVVKGLVMRSESNDSNIRKIEQITDSHGSGGLMGNAWVRKAFIQSSRVVNQEQEANPANAQPFQTPVVHRPDLMNKIADKLVPRTSVKHDLHSVDPTRQQGILKQIARRSDEQDNQLKTNSAENRGILHDPLGWKVLERSNAGSISEKSDLQGMLKTEIKRNISIGNSIISNLGKPEAGGVIESKLIDTANRRQGLLGNTEAWQKYQTREFQPRMDSHGHYGIGERPGLLGAPDRIRQFPPNTGIPGDKPYNLGEHDQLPGGR